MKRKAVSIAIGAALVTSLWSTAAAAQADGAQRDDERTTAIAARSRAASDPRFSVASPAEFLPWLTHWIFDVPEGQRRSPADTLKFPPYVTSNDAIDWLPNIRVSPPDGEAVLARPARWVDVMPMPVSTANTQVASGRGNDAMLIGLTVRFPWLLP